MASLIKRREHWYARVKWRTSESKWQKIKEVPLKTKAKEINPETINPLRIYFFGVLFVSEIRSFDSILQRIS